MASTVKRSRPIGVFDSGVGGLTVIRSIRKCMPDEDIVYFGDTARVPYGNKSKTTIIRFSKEIMEFMMARNVKMAVVACNTASSLAIGALNRHYPVPVTGVIVPGVKQAVSVSKNKRIGVIGTSSTIASRAYNKELARIASSHKLFSKECPLFVPLVENRFASELVTEEIARKYLKGLKAKLIDTLILGCTHYPILKTVIGKVMGDVELVDSSRAVAEEVKEILTDKGLRVRPGKKRGRIHYFVSDDAEGFRKTAGIFLKEKIDVKRAVL